MLFQGRSEGEQEEDRGWSEEEHQAQEDELRSHAEGVFSNFSLSKY